MTLPVPDLDDRRFQDIVDEAKRMIPRLCPEWTDHNLSDPGVALIELFAWMTEMIIYRLNHVPDVVYVRFLELMGVGLQPPAPARTRLTFWLSAPQPEPVTVPAGTEVGTVRTEQEESVMFITDSDLTIQPPELVACLTSDSEGRYQDRWDDLRAPAAEVTCFASTSPGDAIYFGFADALPGNVLRLDVTARIEGVGVDPDRPPWRWEAWTGDAWEPVTVHRDETGGLNQDGAIVLLLPDRHGALSLGPARAHWVRCRMVDPVGDQPAYRESPQIRTAEVSGLGGSVTGHHGRPVPAERLGRSDGTAGQVFHTRRRPLLPRRPGEEVRVLTSEGAETWTEVVDFADSGPEDRHCAIDAAAGEVRFGPRIRYPDGSLHQHGAIPPDGAVLELSGYRVGGGTAGNVGAGTLTVLKSSIPFIGAVENLQAARGGVDAETIENLKLRGPMTLRSGDRAVTAADFERLTAEASPEVARARCLPPAEAGGPVRVLVVPRIEVPPEQLELDDLALPDELVEAVSSHLDERRILTTEVEIGTPSYQGVTVVARLRSAPGAQPELVRNEALGLLYRYLNPIVGGPEGDGWPFERGLNLGEVFALLSGVDGVTGVEEVLLFLADLRTGERGEGRQRIALRDEALFASYQHQVMVR